MSYENKIIPLRNEIDLLDREILEILKRRFEVVEKVGNLKKEYNVKPLDESRWNLLLEEKISIGKEKGMGKTFITNLWNEIHRESLDKES